MIPITNSAYELLHNGCIALSQVEANGIRIDVDYLNRMIADTTIKVKKLSDELKSDKIYKTWKKIYGQDTNVGSREQLGDILFNHLGYKSVALTDTGRHKTDKGALDTLDEPFVKNVLEIERLKKANSTYLKGILKETVDGYLHPVFNLHLVQTFRSSSDSPNFQNIPIRNPETAKLIRPAIISRNDHQIVEVDYSGIEVHGAAWYHKDPVMLKYLSNKQEDKFGNPLKDMHRDMARQCYMLPKEELYWKKDKADTKRIKVIRYCGKNMFVFPQFYGDYYIDCAKALWDAIGQMKLTTRDGVSLYAHLEQKGVSKLGLCNPEKDPRSGTFEKHIQDVEYDFWNNRFTVYNKWRKNWYYQYKDRGWFDNLTGFRFSGHFKRNEVINYPVQSVAFHCLLWSLIRLQKLLKKYNMKSLIVGQIHDSIVADVHKQELKTYLKLCQQVMIDDIKKHWKFICTPIDIEAEVAPVNGNWHLKEKMVLC